MYNPIDNPDVMDTYQSMLRRYGKDTADRYLLTAQGSSGGLRPGVTLAPTKKIGVMRQTKAAPTLNDPLPKTARSLAVDDCEPIAVALLEKPLEEPATMPVATPIANSQNGVKPVGKLPRKPARSTAAVLQAFEDALGNLISLGKPFMKSHVLAAAGLSPGFYKRNPLLLKRVEGIIADMAIRDRGQPSKEQVTETIAKPQAVASPAVVEPELEPAAAEPEPEPASIQYPIAGLSWSQIQAESQRWIAEQVRLTGEIRKLELQLDAAMDNANAYARVLELHTPQ